MKNLSKKYLSLSAIAALALLAPVLSANAVTTTVKTKTEAVPIAGYTDVDFGKMDANKDGMLTRKEVGAALYLMFDRDSNAYISLAEWDIKNVMTISPMVKKTYKYVDMNDDGSSVLTSYAQEDFWATSGLAKWDNNGDGLSAYDFLGQNFSVVDTDHDNRVTYKEFERVYFVRAFDYLHNDNTRYNGKQK